MATNFLEYSGGTNGFLTTPTSILTTELNTLSNGNSATQSVAGNFSQASFGSGIWGIADFVSGGAFTPTAGGFISGWFLFSPDGGTTFEKTTSNLDMPRPPDFTIPLTTAAYASSDVAQGSGVIRMPWWTWKAFVVNHSGAALPASGNIIKLASVAVQY
jgi:hypothetical protein